MSETTPVRRRSRPVLEAQASKLAEGIKALEAHKDEPLLTPKKVTGEEGYITTHRIQYASRRVVAGSEVETEEKIRVPIFHTAPATVEVAGSVTRNLGDFNSCRVEVRVSLPALPEISEIDRVYLLASNLADRYIERELNIATGQADPSSPLSPQE